VSTERDAIQARTRSDGLRLLRTINDTQAHGQEGARAYPPRAAQEAGLEVGSERYEDAMAYRSSSRQRCGETSAWPSTKMSGTNTSAVTGSTSSPGER
jgi:hypothetical protein